MRALIALLLLTVPAFAQVAPAPLDQALGEKLVQEVNENVQLRAIIVDLKRQLADAQSRLPKDDKKK